MRSSVRPGVDEHEPSLAREGTVWMCGACGRTRKDRDNLGDTSCQIWAVLVREDSIKRDETGRAIGAEAVNDETSEITW
jgi:hypothetical protein